MRQKQTEVFARVWPPALTEGPGVPVLPLPLSLASSIPQPLSRGIGSRCLSPPSALPRVLLVDAQRPTGFRASSLGGREGSSLRGQSSMEDKVSSGTRAQGWRVVGEPGGEGGQEEGSVHRGSQVS